MEFVLYTQKSIRDCTKSITDRLEEKETKTRPAMDGWIEKGGKFSVAVRMPVTLRMSRTTRLTATAERQSGMTVIRGYVSTGVPRERIAIIMIALAVVGAVIAANGQAVLGIFAALFGLGLYVPLVGDYNNSSYLLKELKRILAAKDVPPKSTKA